MNHKRFSVACCAAIGNMVYIAGGSNPVALETVERFVIYYYFIFIVIVADCPLFESSKPKERYRINTVDVLVAFKTLKCSYAKGMTRDK